MTTAADRTVELDFSLSPAAVRKTAEEALARAKKRLDEIAALKFPAFGNTVAALDRVTDDLASETAACTFLKYVSPDPAVREAGHSCESELEKFSVDVFARLDLYEAVKACAAEKTRLDGPDKKLLEKTLKAFRRNGLDLPPLERCRFGVLTKQLLDMELEFGKNLNEVKDFIEVSQEELDGLPEDYIARLEKTASGKYKITMDYPDVRPFLAQAKDAGARKRLLRAFGSRAVPQNVALLEEVLRLRRRLAGMLGCASHADFVLAERMAENPKTVAEFLSRIRERLEEKGRRDYNRLLALKKKDDPQADAILAWDYAYYANLLLKTEYRVDEEKNRAYFPMEKVLKGMFKVYETLLSIELRELPAEGLWHPDVRAYETVDAQTGEGLGFFYLDLFPREGKYKHAAAFPLIRGRREPDGSYRRPRAAMVANFNKPAKSKPSLLSHPEVETLFHEFGHIMHNALTRARHARFAGTHVVWDFVEAPSQMLENWVWQKEVLKKISGHYETGEPLPDETLDRMLAAKNATSGAGYLRQLAYAAIDQAFHAGETPDLEATYRKLSAEIAMIPPAEGTRPEASFGHLMGYAAAYYSYLWAIVFSADMFSVFEKEGVLNPETGKRYRKIVLEPGGEGDERGYVVEFLGREPSEDAFLKSIASTHATPAAGTESA